MALAYPYPLLRINAAPMNTETVFVIPIFTPYTRVSISLTSVIVLGASVVDWLGVLKVNPVSLLLDDVLVQLSHCNLIDIVPVVRSGRVVNRRYLRLRLLLHLLMQLGCESLVIDSLLLGQVYLS